MIKIYLGKTWESLIGTCLPYVSESNPNPPTFGIINPSLHWLPFVPTLRMWQNLHVWPYTVTKSHRKQTKRHFLFCAPSEYGYFRIWTSETSTWMEMGYLQLIFRGSDQRCYTQFLSWDSKNETQLGST